MTVLDLDQSSADRARMLARVLPHDVDLDDEGDVIRELYAHRFCGDDFDDILAAVIDWARIERRVWA